MEFCFLAFLYSIFLITLKWFQRQESEAIKNTVTSKLEVLHRSKFFSIRFTVTSQFSRPYDMCIFSPTNAKHMLCNSSQTPANSNSQGIWCPSLSSAGICMHMVHICTYTQNKAFKRDRRLENRHWQMSGVKKGESQENRLPVTWLSVCHSFHENQSYWPLTSDVAEAES